MCREFTQKQVVSRGVADQPTDKKASEALFLQLHLSLFNSSLEMTIWLQSLAHRTPVRWETRCAETDRRCATFISGDADLLLHRNEEEKAVRR